MFNVYSAGRGAETKGVTETEAAREINRGRQSSIQTQTISGTKRSRERIKGLLVFMQILIQQSYE